MGYTLRAMLLWTVLSASVGYTVGWIYGYQEGVTVGRAAIDAVGKGT